MARGLDSRPTSKESNDGKTGIDIGWRRCPSFVGEWGKALNKYLDRHHEMSRAHHSHHAFSSEKRIKRPTPCNAWMPYCLEETRGGYHCPLKTTTEIHER
ncbi:unnamed protein product [Spirodela intermedia]|uniref:Uncharacterized protein n=1 Tax=Spirodela intermedia TaxID=51605 RepID=A0A7I8JF91_SPIIN|nr:unnamed protein product [Spirodela intermedia]CAA6668814.1 unnamed protein product [Spirodela intermedia]